MDDTLIESLRRLRSEEAALISTLARARDGGKREDEISRSHRRLLGQLRASIEERLPQAVEHRDRVIERLTEVESSACRAHDRLDDVRSRVRNGEIDAAEASTAAAAHQQGYERALNEVSRLKHQLGVLAEFLPGSVARTSPGPAGVAASVSVGVPPVQAQRSASLAAAEWGEIYSTQVALAEADLAPDEPGGDGGGSRAGSPEPIVDPPEFELSRASYRKDTRSDRRRHQRFAFVAAVKFRTEGVTSYGRSSDISARGMFIDSQNTVPVGSMVTCVFSAEGYPAEIDGRVVFESRSVGVGVMFTQVPEEDRPYLERLVDRLATADAVLA